MGWERLKVDGEMRNRLTKCRRYQRRKQIQRSRLNMAKYSIDLGNINGDTSVSPCDSSGWLPDYRIYRGGGERKRLGRPQSAIDTRGRTSGISAPNGIRRVTP